MINTQQNSRPANRARLLIVNADDFGRSDAVNLGVAEGFRRGIVTSASLVAAGPAFDQAVAIAKEIPALGVGIHLIANEYTPSLPPVEIPNLSAVADIVLQLARKYSIGHARLPAEPIWWKPGLNLSPRFVEKTVLNLATQVPRQVWKGKLRYPGSFYGFSQGGRMSADVVYEVARSAPGGISELMVHVAVSNEEAPGFWTGYDYAGDLRAVTTHSKAEFEKEFGVSLVTHV